jgi:hypothetical protein
MKIEALLLGLSECCQSGSRYEAPFSPSMAGQGRHIDANAISAA